METVAGLYPCLFLQQEIFDGRGTGNRGRLVELLAMPILIALLGASWAIAGDEIRPVKNCVIPLAGNHIYTERKYKLPVNTGEIVKGHKKDLEQGGEPPPQEGVLGADRVQIFSAEQRFLFIRGPEEDHRKARELVRKLWLWSRQDQRNKK